MPRPQRCWSSCLVALAVLAGPGSPPGRAADGKTAGINPAARWPVARGPSREPAPFRYDPAQVRRLPKEFLEDATACVLYAGTTYLVEPDGTVETTTHEVSRLNGRKGIDRLGEYRNISYDPSYQKLTLNEARIHKADGRQVAVEPRHVQLRDAGTDFLIYDRDKQLIISFPTLEAGDTIEVQWTVRGKNPEHGGQFFTRYTFGDLTFPVAVDELRVRLPRDKPFKYGTEGGQLDPTRTAAGGFRTYHWKATNVPRPPQDENLPPREELRVSVACSTFASWDEVGAWKQRLRADCWRCTADVDKVVQEVTRGLTDPTARARALTYWVRRHVRYVSAGEKHDYTPHPPDQVLANRYGDCKDTSQLLAVMLRAAGLRVALATLGALDDGQVLEAVPSPWGTHAILLVTIDGQEHWIDTTATLAGWDFLPRSDRDRLCYVVDVPKQSLGTSGKQSLGTSGVPKQSLGTSGTGPPRLVRTPALTAADNRTEQTTEVRIGADGSSRCERTVTSHGLAALVQRDALVEVPAGERRQQVVSELQDANGRTRLVRLAVDEAALNDYDRPVKARLVFEVPSHFSGSPDREGTLSDSKVWGKLLAYNLDYDRQMPFVFQAPFESRHRFVVHVPPAYAVDALPRNKTVRSPWGFFRLRVRALDPGEWPRVFELDFHTRLDRDRVEPGDFEEFRKFHEEVSRDHRVWLTLKPIQDLADAPLLEAVLAFVPADNVSAAVLARLYLSNRRPADARRVLRRALHYRPDDAPLWELLARSADGPGDEEEARRELARRFPEEPARALDLGAFLITRGRQDEARKLLEPLTRRGAPADRARAHYQLARSYYRRDELKEALGHIDKAFQAEPDALHTVQVHLLKGQINEELGRLATAARAYQDALAVDRESEKALESLVRLALAAGNRGQALDHLRRYTLLVGDDAAGLLLAAHYYLRLGRYDDARDLASRVRDEAFRARAQRVLGLVAFHRGDWAGAVGHLQEGEQDADALAALVRAAVRLGALRDLPARLEKAAKVGRPTGALRRACELARRLLDRRAALAREYPAPPGREAEWPAALDALVCAEQARAEGAPPARVEALLEPAFAGGLELGPAYALRARLALDHGRLSRALADAERAVARSPKEPGGHYVRGRVRLERNAPGALDDLQKAAGLSARQDADVLHALAEALFRAGRRDEALAAQRAAVKLKPHDREMAEQLSAFEKAVGKEGPPRLRQGSDARLGPCSGS